jgi:hypothetical protein
LEKYDIEYIGIIQDALYEVHNIDIIKLLLMKDFSVVDGIIIHNSSVEVARYIHSEYDFDTEVYNKALLLADRFDKIQFLIEECHANNYNEALVSICNNDITVDALKIIKYLVKSGANNYNDALYALCNDYSPDNDLENDLKILVADVALYLINLGADNIPSILKQRKISNIYTFNSDDPLFRMLVRCCDCINTVFGNQQQINFVKNGVGVFLNKNKKLLTHPDVKMYVKPYIKHRKRMLKLLSKSNCLLPELYNIVLGYLDYEIYLDVKVSSD